MPGARGVEQQLPSSGSEEVAVATAHRIRGAGWLSGWAYEADWEDSMEQEGRDDCMEQERREHDWEDRDASFNPRSAAD